jgi:uncharacterized protein
LAQIAMRYFDISAEGNFEGSNILHRTIDLAEAARLFHKTEDEMMQAIATIRQKLFVAREARVKPGRDEKILAAWNGMMISALAEGYRATGEQAYLTGARRAVEFVMAKLWDGRALRRSVKDGVARFNAYLEDYALMAGAMIDTYEATLEQQYLEIARTLADVILERFSDTENGGFFFTSNDHEALITRSKAAFDGSTPSGNSAAVSALLRLHAYTGEQKYLQAAERTIMLFAAMVEKQPFAFSHMIEAIDLYERGPTDIVIVGDRASAEFHEWVERLGLIYVANGTLFTVDPNRSNETLVPEPAQGKSQIDGKLTAYVCRERTCSTPITSFKALESELAG